MYIRAATLYKFPRRETSPVPQIYSWGDALYVGCAGKGSGRAGYTGILPLYTSRSPRDLPADSAQGAQEDGEAGAGLG